MKVELWGVAAALACALAQPAAAEQGRTVRLTGSAPTAEDPMAKAFVLDLTLTKGEGAFQQTAEGWYAALPPSVGSGEAKGTCVHSQCAIDVDQSDAKLSLSGDFTGPASSGRFALTGDEGKVTAEGAARFEPLSGAVPGVGALAAPDAVSGAELKSLLEWGGISVSTGNAEPPALPDDTERDALARWQNAQGEPMTGLVTAADLAALRGQAAAAKAKAGWTKIGDEAAGWTAGYPATLLPKASAGGGERRFASADGKAQLVVTIERGLSDDDFSALVDKLTADAPDRSDKQYTRVNNDLDLSYVEAGRRVTVACHNRSSGLARLEFSRPADEDERWSLYDLVLPSGFSVSDDLKMP